jgi:hypothetical protein
MAARRQPDRQKGQNDRFGAFPGSLAKRNGKISLDREVKTIQKGLREGRATLQQAKLQRDES